MALHWACLPEEEQEEVYDLSVTYEIGTCPSMEVDL